jgi:hypothetical protein
VTNAQEIVARNIRRLTRNRARETVKYSAFEIGKNIRDSEMSGSSSQTQKNETQSVGEKKTSVESRVDIIGAIKNPLTFFALVVLVAEAILGGLAVSMAVGFDRTLIIAGMISLLFLLVVVVAIISYKRPRHLYVFNPDQDTGSEGAGNSAILSKLKEKEEEMADLMKEKEQIGLNYYNENSDNPKSDERDKIEKTLVQEVLKSSSIKILINTAEYVFASKASYLNMELVRKNPESIKVLLLDPEAREIIGIRSKAIGYTYAQYKNEIETSIEFCKMQKIECKLFNIMTPFRLFIFDDARAYVQFYLKDKSGDASPMYGFKTIDTCLGSAFMRYFETVFSSAKPA